MESISKILYNYGIDIQDDLDVSPFEYVNTLRARDYLEERRLTLSDIHKKELKRLDSILLSRANEFYKYLKPTKCWGEKNIPIKNWWWHLDKIVAGIINVDVEKNLIRYL